MSQASSSLAVPGVVQVGNAEAPDGAVVSTGPAAGWLVPTGIAEWSQELSVIVRADLSEALRTELGVTLPEHRVAKGRHPHAHRAAETMKIVGVSSELVPQLVEKGIRVHTIGYDRVSGGFVYLVEGGKEPPVNIHGDLLEMISPALEGGSSNDDIQRYLDGFIDRLLRHSSKGVIDELAVEVANALPRLSTGASGLAGVDLDAFEAQAAAHAEQGKKHEDGAKKLAAAIDTANGQAAVSVPLFGEAKSKTQPAMEILVGGEPMTLPARTQWVVKGAIQEARETPAPAPVSKPVSKPVESKPVAAKPVAKVTTPSPAPAAAKPAAKAVTPSPAPAVVKPVPATPTPAPASPRVPTPSPKVPSVLGAKPAVVEAKPEPVVEAKPEPKVEAKKPEPKVEEKKPEPKPEAKQPKAEEKLAKAEEPEAKPEVAAAAPEPKSSPMVYVIIAILVIAALAFFMMKK